MHTGNEKKLVKEAKGHRCSKLLIFSDERSDFFLFFILNIKLPAIWLNDLSTNFTKENPSEVIKKSNTYEVQSKFCVYGILF